MNRTLTLLLMLAPAALADGTGGGAVSPAGGTERPADRVETLDFPDRLRAEFRPDDPGIVLTYDLSFRLLGVTLFRLGEMRVEAMTGHMAGDAAKAPASLLDCRMSPPPAADPRAVLRDRFVLLADEGGRKTLVFAQLADKSYRILGGRPKRYLRFDVNDYRGAEPYTYRTNLITGTSAARIGERPGRERPGESVMALLALLAEVHTGSQAGVDERSSPRFFAHVDGETRPFVVRTSRGDPPGEFPRERIDALRADVSSAPEAKTARGHLAAWVLPFADLAREAGLKVRDDLARHPPVPIVPLAADVDLAVGSVRAVMKGLVPADRAPTPEGRTDGGSGRSP